MSLHLQSAPTVEPEDPDRLFGQIMRHLVDEAQGAGAGERFRDLVISPTRPATRERKLQDRAWALLSARLNKLAAEQGGRPGSEQAALDIDGEDSSDEAAA